MKNMNRSLSDNPIVLCLDSDPSFLKFALYRFGAAEVRLAHGAVERIGCSRGHLWVNGKDDRALVDVHGDFPTHMAAVGALCASFKDLGLPQPTCAGHRAVHGGEDHTTPQRVDAHLLADLRKRILFAPQHLPSILVIEAIGSFFPKLPQVVCFDTAFHSRMPEVARRLPDVRHYGFHGLSFEYVVTTLGTELHGRLIIAHLGYESCLAAVLDGQPLDTTMSFTSSGGLLTEPHTAEAVESFCYELRKHIGALTAVLGGLDILVFSGEIGERAAPVRWEACRGLEYLGITLDSRRNAVHGPVISVPGSDCRVLVIPANEELMIARHTRTLLAGSGC